MSQWSETLATSSAGLKHLHKPSCNGLDRFSLRCSGWSRDGETPRASRRHVSREKRRSARSPAAAAAVLPTCRIAQINWYRPESFATPDVTSRQTAANPRAAAFLRPRVRLTPRPPSRAVSPSPGAKRSRAASRERQAVMMACHPPRSEDGRGLGDHGAGWRRCPRPHSFGKSDAANL